MKDLANKVSETAHLVIDALTAHRVETNELCVGHTCVTEEQFNSVFSNQPTATGATAAGDGQPLEAEAPAASPEPEADSTDTAPLAHRLRVDQLHPPRRRRRLRSKQQTTIKRLPMTDEPEEEDVTDQQPVAPEEQLLTNQS